MDERYIGVYAEDGRVERYPSLDLSGREVAPPLFGVRGIGARHFVALPPASRTDYTSVYEAAVALVASLSPNGDTKKRRKSDPTESSDEAVSDV